MIINIEEPTQSILFIQMKQKCDEIAEMMSKIIKKASMASVEYLDKMIQIPFMSKLNCQGLSQLKILGTIKHKIKPKFISFK